MNMLKGRRRRQIASFLPGGMSRPVHMLRAARERRHGPVIGDANDECFRRSVQVVPINPGGNGSWTA